MTYFLDHPWTIFGILASAGVWFNQEDKDAQKICFYSALSVSLGLIITMTSGAVSNEHYAYTMYAIADALLCYAIYRIAKLNPRYHSITLLFLGSILTHLTFQFYLLINNPMLSGTYFDIMVFINSMIIISLMVLSNGFNNMGKYILGVFNGVYSRKASLRSQGYFFPFKKDS